MISLEIVEHPAASDLCINWIGQAGFLIKIPEGPLVCIDPYYSNSIERYEGRKNRRIWYNNFKIEDFKPDLVFCSHDHLDHTDPETLPLIYSYSDAVFFGPESSKKHMEKMKFSQERLQLLVPDSSVDFETFYLIPKQTYHTEDSLGLLFQINDMTVYFTGDTALDSSLDFIRDEKIDILISCVNGKYNNMTVIESAELYKIAGAKLIIPMHYGLIPDNTVEIDEIEETYKNEGVEYFIPKIEQYYRVIRS